MFAYTKLMQAMGGFSPSQLFAAGEQGAWYDPSDFSTMFQDAAGTTPVTAIEQPVGRILDKSGRGNHASQSTTTSRPILRNLYNLLQRTEEFDNAVWVKAGLAVTQNSVTAPNGLLIADALYETATNAVHEVRQTLSASAGNKTFSVDVQGIGRQYLALQVNDGVANGAGAVFDLTSAAYVGTTSVGTTFSLLDKSITPLGNNWFTLTITVSAPSTGNHIWCVMAKNSSSLTWGLAYEGDITKGFAAINAAVVPANEASLPYQRVVTNTLGSGVYDTDLSKFKPYLAFDGTDDFLVTGNINFSATDKRSMFAGIRKLSSGTQIFAELSTNWVTNAGTFAIYQDTGSSQDYASAGRGSLFSSTQVASVPAGYAAPITNVLSSNGDIAGDLTTLRINASLVASATGDKGTGNYGNYPLYIGRRGGITLPLNGRVYSLIVRGALTASPQLEQTETWVNGKTGAY